MDAHIKELIGPKTLWAVCHSGGKDSQALGIFAAANLPKEHTIWVHADLGEIEWQGTKDHVEQLAKDAGAPLILAYPRFRDGRAKDFFDMVRDNHAKRPTVNPWPTKDVRQCTSDLKRDPMNREIRRYANKHGYTTVVILDGVRAEESDDRAAMSPWQVNERETNSKRAVYDWKPLHAWTKEQVIASVKDAGQELHWAYATGNERLSCQFCILGCKSDLQNAYRHNPALAAKYTALEQEVGFTMYGKKVKKQFVGQTLLQKIGVVVEKAA